MMKHHCICNTFPDAGNGCLSPPTQEDLLCDPCRVWEIRNREVKAGKRKTTGIHASGLDGCHMQWNVSSQELGLRPLVHEVEPDGTWQSTGQANLPDTEPDLISFHRYGWELDDLVGQQAVIVTKPEDTI